MTGADRKPRHLGRLVVTGANGFVGRAVVDAARRAGLAVLPVVRSAAGMAGEVVLGDIGPSTSWTDVLEAGDTVVHAAALAHGRADSDAQCFQVNTAGAQRLAAQAAVIGVRRLVFLSSIGVLGAETKRRPFSEADPSNPHTTYARSKMAAEDALWKVGQESGLQVVVVRPPLVYGPSAPGNFGRLIRWLEQGVPLPLAAVTDNRRSLVALDNLVDFLLTCAGHAGAANHTFLVADGEDVSTADLLRRTARAMGRPARLFPVPARLLGLSASMLGKKAVADQLLGSLQIDLSKAREVLGWEPPISVDEGLRRAVDSLTRQ